MSVDHYDCQCCGDTGIYEEYTADTECCGERICSHCCVGSSGHTFIYDYCNPEHGLVKKEHCPFCSGDKVSDKQIIEFLLERTGMSAKDVRKEILRKRNPPPPLDESRVEGIVRGLYPDMENFSVEWMAMDDGKYVVDFDYDTEFEMSPKDTYDLQTRLFEELGRELPEYKGMIVVVA